MLKKLLSRTSRKFRLSFRECLTVTGAWRLILCSLCTLLPAMLLSLLALGRVIYMPHSLAAPPLPWGIYLPLWVLGSLLPAITAGAMYGALYHRKQRLFSSFALLLISIWLYHAWMLLCLCGAGAVTLFLTAFLCALCAVWILPYAASASMGTLLPALCFAVWCILLFLLSIATLA